MQRYGMTIPLRGPILEQESWIKEMADRGYTDFWSAESGDNDGFTPLVLAASWVRHARVGTAIIPAYTRGPGTLAASVAALADAAPGRSVVGIGSSSNVIVEKWNNVPFEKPYQRVRDTVEFLKRALTGEKIDQEFETFRVQGYKLNRVPAQQPSFMIAALRSGMLSLAGKISDGGILNWLSAEDMKVVAPYVRKHGANKELVARLMVIPSTDRAFVETVGRRAICAYLNVPVYAAFHEWLGRGEMLKPMWDAWKAGDRKAATELVPSKLIDDLFVTGSPGQCKEHIQRYVDNGLTTPVLSINGADRDLRQITMELAPH